MRMETATEVEPPGASVTVAKRLSRVRKSFCESLRRALGVAGRTGDGQPKKITQVSVSATSGVARSTIAKYLAAKDDNVEMVNPDLETLCRLAHTLNISPAYLLMTPEDWQRLAHGAAALVAAARTTALAELATSTRASGPMNPAQQALAGLDVAKRLGVAPLNITIDGTSAADVAIADEVGRINERARCGLLATCALPPLATMPPECERILLYFCAVIGANNQ